MVNPGALGSSFQDQDHQIPGIFRCDWKNHFLRIFNWKLTLRYGKKTRMCRHFKCDEVLIITAYGRKMGNKSTADQVERQHRIIVHFYDRYLLCRSFAQTKDYGIQRNQ